MNRRKPPCRENQKLVVPPILESKSPFPAVFIGAPRIAHESKEFPKVKMQFIGTWNSCPGEKTKEGGYKFRPARVRSEKPHSGIRRGSGVLLACGNGHQNF